MPVGSNLVNFDSGSVRPDEPSGANGLEHNGGEFFDQDRK